jgi:hypothetical protein
MNEKRAQFYLSQPESLIAPVSRKHTSAFLNLLCLGGIRLGRVLWCCLLLALRHRCTQNANGHFLSTFLQRARFSKIDYGADHKPQNGRFVATLSFLELVGQIPENGGKSVGHEEMY